ncbi:unnamed protein product [Linum trigynum]|uniref:Uncharacterized protein n=1 Tax=Linum trigynum TaxID=586398 RepID=A0AAV2GNQ2_9ROSI
MSWLLIGVGESVRRHRETGGDSAAGGLREGGEQDRARAVRLRGVDVAVLGARAVELWRRRRNSEVEIGRSLCRRCLLAISSVSAAHRFSSQQPRTSQTKTTHETTVAVLG